MSAPALIIQASEPEYEAMLADLSRGSLAMVARVIDATAHIQGGEITFRVGPCAVVRILAEAGPDTPYPGILEALHQGSVTPAERPDIRWNGVDLRARAGGQR